LTNFSKQELIASIYKKYNIRFPESTTDKVLLDIYFSKYHFLEVLNIRKRGKKDKFERSDLRSVSLNDIKRFVKKYVKKPLPPNLPRNLVIDVLLGKLDPEKLSDEDLKKFGKAGRNSLTGAAGLYAGWIPKVKKHLEKGDLKRGKREARRYK